MIRCVNIVLILLSLNWGRWDLTEDHRFSVSPATRAIVEQLDSPLEIQVLLDEGKHNSGFERLNQATHDLIDELRTINANCIEKDVDLTALDQLQPTIVHERSRDGQMIQTNLYPYAILTYKGHHRVIKLIQNNPGCSGEENLNGSIETLEYRLAEAIQNLQSTQVERIVFLEGHGELSERDVYDWCCELSNYYQIDRGMLGNVPDVLDGYQVVIIADPRESLSETDKFIIDQYIMHGGRVMWLLDGVRFSDQMLTENGLTPIIAEDWGLRDMLFHYGVRINPVLIQDIQCRMMPVEVSGDAQNPQFQPIPWTFAPLLLTSEASPITKNVSQVRTMMASQIEAVGGDDGIDKQVLLATSSASTMIGAPAEVNLMDQTIHPEMFTMAFLPVAMSLEGEFHSLYAHRLPPEDMQTTITKVSPKTRQIVVAGAQMAVGEWQQNKPLPVGYDQYMKIQFGNRDFLVNAVLWLTDNNGLIDLRSKHIPLRLLNDQRTHQIAKQITIISVITPIAILALVGGVVLGIRKKKYVA